MAQYRLLWVCGFFLLLASASSLNHLPATQDERNASAPDLWLTVRETGGIARNGEIVRSGVPLARAWAVTNTDSLTIVDDAGTPIPAEFQVLARWHAGRHDLAAAIQWLLVTFPATVAAYDTAAYRLVLDGSAGTNPAPPLPLQLTQNGDQMIVDTGVATFAVGAQPEHLFDEVRLAHGIRLLQGGVMTATVNGMNVNHTNTRRVYVEHAGPLSAVVVVEGAYNMSPIGGGGVGTLRRYIFTAGSPTAIVRQAVNWEGDLCPSNGYDLTCNGNVNGIRITRIRDALALDVGAPRTVTAIGARQQNAIAGTVSTGQSAWVRQALRARRMDPLAFDVHVPGTVGATGQKADGGMLAVSGPSGAAVIALPHMHRYEPQALRLLADGHIAIDLADDQVWLGQRQGLFATFAVSALSPNPERNDLDEKVWAPLNRPLRAWPSPEWFSASDAVDEFPVGSLSGELVSYDESLAAVLERTLQQIDEKGLPGLMTFGVYPRYWGNPMYGDELDCWDDPTPGGAWDDLYWCATWTDYHNTIAAAPVWAMRSGEVEWLDEIAFPGALRMLHTQIMQCAPDDNWFYCGQAPAGYGGYRLDFNSSHAYFDNLFLYYWLTGDFTVVETLRRGASSMRDYLCVRRPAAPCLPDDPPDDFWAQLTGRTAMQWFAVFRFVGLASDDPTYLEDYQSGLARAVTQHYVEATQAGKDYGFWLYGGDPVVGPGTYSTDQLWMVSLYDTELLYRLQRDTNDAPIGNPALPPSQVLAAWARTLVDFGATVSGDGTAAGNWPNALHFTWSGSRVGGVLHSVSANTAGGDPYLYSTGKANLPAVLLRAGQHAGESALQDMGRELTLLTLDAVRDNASPLGKEPGLYWSRLHAAVARLASPASPDATPTPSPTASATPLPTVTPTATPVTFPSHCTPDADGDNWVTILDVQARAVDLSCITYLPLIITFWRQPWP